MPVTPTYPGVYIEEIPSGVRTITGVATSITAFVGRTFKGPVNDPTRIQSFAEFERRFGGLWSPSTVSYAVQHYFQHGGSDAIIVRVYNEDATDGRARVKLDVDAMNADPLELVAANPGTWANSLRADVDWNTANNADNKLFNLTIEQVDSAGQVVAQEKFRNVSVDEASPRYVGSVLENGSANVRIVPPTTPPIPARLKEIADKPFTGGHDGKDVEFGDVEGSDADKTGIYALEKADLFNLLCIPPLTRDKDIPDTTQKKAAKYCRDRRALFIADPLDTWTDKTTALKGVNQLRADVGGDAINVAVYFPRLQLADPLKDNATETFVPCGAVAGIMARTDAQRGVWKAPAGIEAALAVRTLSYKLTDGENGQLNPFGLNCLRTFPVSGHVVWGARTVAGADLLASDWKYVPVRRLALFLEESLYRGTQWVVFEPNDEPLWAQIRLNVGAFMHNLFRQGAFQGQTPREAYLVKCDKETTTQNDINLGIVNIVVGFAPLKPAEFVIIKIQQLAGQIQA